MAHQFSCEPLVCIQTIFLKLFFNWNQKTTSKFSFTQLLHTDQMSCIAHLKGWNQSYRTTSYLLWDKICSGMKLNNFRAEHFSLQRARRLRNASSAAIFVGTRFSRGISSSTWHTCFRARADDRGKNASGSPSYRKVLRVHVLSRCANTRRRWKIFGRGGNEKPRHTRVMRMIFFFATVILLYDRPFFSCAHRIRTSVFNPSGKKTYR